MSNSTSLGALFRLQMYYCLRLDIPVNNCIFFSNVLLNISCSEPKVH